MSHHHAGPLFVLHQEQVAIPAHGAVVHVEHAITLVVSGALDFDCGQTVRVGPGSIVLVPAGVPHRSLGGEGVTYWLAGFCGACLGLEESDARMEPFARVREGALPVARLPPDRVAWAEQLFRELSRVDGAGIDRAEPLLALLLAEARDADALEVGKTTPDSLVGGALRFIQREAFRPISLRDVARAVHRSPTHVAATIKRETGHTVGAWITAQRVAEAARWLGHTDLTLEEIASRVGWKDKTHFIRMFKRHHGVTPAAWRRQQAHRRLGNGSPPDP